MARAGVTSPVVYTAVKPITSRFMGVASHLVPSGEHTSILVVCVPRPVDDTYHTHFLTCPVVAIREWLEHLQRYYRGNGMYIADAC